MTLIINKCGYFIRLNNTLLCYLVIKIVNYLPHLQKYTPIINLQ